MKIPQLSKQQLRTPIIQVLVLQEILIHLEEQIHQEVQDLLTQQVTIVIRQLRTQTVQDLLILQVLILQPVEIPIQVETQIPLGTQVETQVIIQVEIQTLLDHFHQYHFVELFAFQQVQLRLDIHVYHHTHVDGKDVLYVPFLLL